MRKPLLNTPRERCIRVVLLQKNGWRNPYRSLL
jgi:hypothetical protein